MRNNKRSSFLHVVETIFILPYFFTFFIFFFFIQRFSLLNRMICTEMMIWLFLVVSSVDCQDSFLGGSINGGRRQKTGWRPRELKSGICTNDRTLPCCKHNWKIFEQEGPIRNRYYKYKSCSEDGYYESPQCNRFKRKCECVNKETGKSDRTENCERGVDICAKLKCECINMVTGESDEQAVPKLEIMKKGICATRSTTEGPPCCRKLWKTSEGLCSREDLSWPKCAEDGSFSPKQ